MNMQDARDAMNAAAQACLPNGFPTAWPDKSFTVPTATPWARVTIKHAGRHQKGFGDDRRKFVAYGVMCIELLVPPGDGNTTADKLADGVVIGLESLDSSPIWYRNIRAVEAGSDGGFNKFNVYAEFEYEDHH